MEILALLGLPLVGAALLLSAVNLLRPSQSEGQEAGAQPAQEELAGEEAFDAAEQAVDECPAQTVRATIRSASRDMDLVTLQGWSRVTFDCEDGERRKMYFPGENGIYMRAGECGMLEHRDGAFISFEKDSGEIVGVLFHIPAGAGEE